MGSGKKHKYWPRSVANSNPIKTFNFEWACRSNNSSQPSCVLTSVKARPSSPCDSARAKIALGLRGQPRERWLCTCMSMSMANRLAQCYTLGRMFTGVKVFSATKAKEREELSDNVTRWIRSNSDFEIVDKVVAQSSDNEFHCYSLVLFYKQKGT